MANRKPKIDNLIRWQAQLDLARAKTSEHQEAIRVLQRKMVLLRCQLLYPNEDVKGFCNRCGLPVMRRASGEDVHVIVTPKQSLPLVAYLGGIKPCGRPTCTVWESMRP